MFRRFQNVMRAPDPEPGAAGASAADKGAASAAAGKDAAGEVQKQPQADAEPPPEDAFSQALRSHLARIPEADRPAEIAKIRNTYAALGQYSIGDQVALIKDAILRREMPAAGTDDDDPDDEGDDEGARPVRKPTRGKSSRARSPREDDRIGKLEEQLTKLVGALTSERQDTRFSGLVDAALLKTDAYAEDKELREELARRFRHEYRAAGGDLDDPAQVAAAMKRFLAREEQYSEKHAKARRAYAERKQRESQDLVTEPGAGGVSGRSGRNMDDVIKAFHEGRLEDVLPKP